MSASRNSLKLSQFYDFLCYICYIFIFISNKLQTTTCLIPNHVDFRKLGEVKYHNEVFKVLTPQLHVVKYSRDVLRRENDFPKEGVLIDTSGRVHFWKNINNNSEGYKETKMDNTYNLFKDITRDSLNNSIKEKLMQYINVDKVKGLSPELKKNNNSKDIIPEKDKSIELTEVFGENTNKSEDNIDTVKINEHSNDTKENHNTDANFKAESENNNQEIATDLPEENITTTRKRRRRKKRVNNKNSLRTGKVKTVVKTTFFCPFIGVITMSSLID